MIFYLGNPQHQNYKKPTKFQSDPINNASFSLLLDLNEKFICTNGELKKSKRITKYTFIQEEREWKKYEQTSPSSTFLPRN